MPLEPKRELRGRTPERGEMLRKINGSPNYRFTSIKAKTDEALQKRKKG